jgi:hypothetical protein
LPPQLRHARRIVFGEQDGAGFSDGAGAGVGGRVGQLEKSLAVNYEQLGFTSSAVLAQQHAELRR